MGFKMRPENDIALRGLFSHAPDIVPADRFTDDEGRACDIIHHNACLWWENRIIKKAYIPNNTAE